MPSMFRLDYISCLLTVASTVLVGRRMWQGLIIAGVNSLIICCDRPANRATRIHPGKPVLCLAIYVYNILAVAQILLPESAATAPDRLQTVW